MHSPDWRSNRLALFALSAFVIACSDSGCDGCGDSGGEGEAPYEFAGSVEDHVVHQAGQVHVTQSGLERLSNNIEPLAASLLGEEGLAFCLETQEINIVFDDIVVCGENTCADGNTGCDLNIGLEDVEIVPRRTADPASDAVDLNATVVIDETLDTSFSGCGLRINTGDGLPVSATLQMRVGAPEWERVSLDLDGNDLDIPLDDIGLSVEGGFVCDVLDGAVGLLRGTLIGLIEDQVGGLIDDAIGPALCQSCSSDLECGEGASCDGESCIVDGTEECVPLPLGVEMAFDLGDLLSDFAPGLDAELGILAYAANFADALGPPGSGLAYEGLDIGLQAGFYSESNSCVPYAAPPATDRVPKSPAIFSDLTPEGDDFMIGIGLARSALNLAGWAAYRSGALCLTVGSDSVEQISTGTFSVLLPSIGDLVGGGNAPMELVLRPQAPPTIDLGLGTVSDSGVIEDPLLTLNLNNLEIDFYVYTEDRYVRLMTLDTDIGVPLALDVNADNQLVVLLGDLTEAITRIDTRNAELLSAEDAGRVATVLPGLIGALLPTLIGDAIDPIDIPELIEGVNLIIPAGGITSVDSGQMLAIYADLEFGAVEEKSRPLVPEIMAANVHQATFAEIEDMISDAQHLGTPLDLELLMPEVSLEMDTFDTAGDAEEFEYSYRINGGLWSTWQRGDTVQVHNPMLALSGTYTVDVQVRAAGEPYSVSRALASTQIVVDYVAPTLSLQRDGLVASVIAEDAQQAGVTVRARVNRGEWLDVTDGTVDLSPWAGRNALVEVEAFDPSGNRAVEQKSFNLDGYSRGGTFTSSSQPAEAGCASAPRPTAPLWALGVVGLLLGLRRRGALVAVAMMSLALGACGDDKSGTKVEDCDPACESGFTCQDGTCVETAECVADEECAAGESCVEGTCAPECTADVDCAGGERCELGECVPIDDGCTIDDDCSEGQYCEGGECIAHECVEDADCSCEGFDTPQCIDNMCACEVPCPEGCADGSACCNPSGECVDVTAVCAGETCDPGFVYTAISDPTFNGDTCETVTECACREMPPLDPGFTGVDLDLAVSPDGMTRAVAAYNQTYGDLMVGYIGEDDSITWEYVDGVPETGTIGGSLNGPRGGISDRGPDVGRYASIAAQDDGTLHVTYFGRTSETPRTLHYAQGVLGESGYEWTISVLDADNNSGYYTDVELNADGFPGVAYLVRAVPAEGQPGYHHEIRFRQALVAAPAAEEDWADTALITILAVADLCGGVCVGSQECRLDTRVCQSPERGSACAEDCGDGECFENEGGENSCSAVAQAPEGVQVLFPGSGLMLDFEYGLDDTLHFAFYDNDNGNLLAAQTVASAPEYTPAEIIAGETFVDGERVDTGNVGLYPDVFVASDGTVYVAFADASNASLRIADLTNGTVTPVDDGVRCYEPDPGGEGCLQPLVLRVGYDSAIAEDESGLYLAYQDATWLEILESPLGEFGWDLPGTIATGGDPYTGAYGFYMGHAATADGRTIVSYRLNQQASPVVRDVAVITR